MTALGFLRDHPEFEIRVNVDGMSRVRLHASIMGGAVKAVEFWKGEESLPVPRATANQGELAFSKIFELRLDHTILGVMPRERISRSLPFGGMARPSRFCPRKGGWLSS